MEPTPDPKPIDRATAVAKLIEQLRTDELAGKKGDDAEFLAAHADLLPELQKELLKLRRVEAARRAAGLAGPGSVATAEALAREFDAPALQIPGYSVIREISRGGQAVVFLAVHLNTGRKVAVKVMHRGPLADDRSLARFKREVQILATLNHPNIVGIIDTGRTEDGGQFISMNYIAGFGLAEYMQRRQKKDGDPSKLLRLFLRICDAVNAAHRQGIVHRDLKPGNIRVDERGEPHILDFGLARTAFDRMMTGGNEPLSITGEFLGSLPWSSPEQAEGDPDLIDVRTDVYSLGVILYQMLTGGKFPYRVVGNIRDVLNNILTSEPTPPSKVLAAAEASETHGNRRIRLKDVAAVNEGIEKIVLKALSKKRERRYQTAGELGRDVANYLAGRKTVARDPELEPPKASPRITTRRMLRVSAAVAACCILSICVWLTWRYFSPTSVTVTIPNLPTSDQLPAPPSGMQWSLAWNDEFDGASIDPGKWSDQLTPSDRQPTDSAFSLDGHGHLIVSVAKDADRFVASHLTTAGKFERAFGCFVCRVLLQEDNGQATAFSLQGTDGTLDIFAERGPGSPIEQAVAIDHQTRRTQGITIPSESNTWHALAVWWTADEYVFLIDGRESWRVPVTEGEQMPRHLLLSSGLNATTSGTSADSMVVDYVRVYMLTKKM